MKERIKIKTKRKERLKGRERRRKRKKTKNSVRKTRSKKGVGEQSSCGSSDVLPEPANFCGVNTPMWLADFKLPV